MSADCLQSTVKMARKHRSLSRSLEPLAMMFMFLLVSSHVIVISFGHPIHSREESHNTTNTSNGTTISTNTSNGTTNSTNTTSLCGEVRCEPGEECVIDGGNVPVCVAESRGEQKQSCSENPVCGNDGITYNNDCEMRKSGIQLKHNGSCFSCQDQSAKYSPEEAKSLRKRKEYIKMCDSLTINNILDSNMFKPECSMEDPDVFVVDQAFEIDDLCSYYWCSTPDGVVIENTFKKTKTDCMSRRSCTFEGKAYKDGSVIKPDCGICECLDGEIKCINDFCGVRGNLTDEQLDLLRSDIYQLFYFQFQFSDHKLIDLRHVRKNPAEKDSADTACSVLNWKFKYYDVNGDGELQPNEQYKFIDEVHDIINFAKFDEQMSAEIDTNNDGLFQFSEWFEYFTADVTEGGDIKWSCELSGKSR